MSTVIKAAAIDSTDDKGSIFHAVRAAEKCITLAGVNRNDIELFINTGNYRDKNINEPAIIGIILKELKIKSTIDNTLSLNKKRFSFDLTNSSCGFLYAACVIDSFFNNQTIKNALIVSGDKHPSIKDLEDFPYSSIGAAVYLEYCTGNKGFKNFCFYTSPTTSQNIFGGGDVLKLGKDGRNLVSVDRKDQYMDELISFAREKVQYYLIKNQIHPHMIHLVSAHPWKNFSEVLADSLGIRTSQENINNIYGDAHTSAIIVDYCEHIKRGYFNDAKIILFVDVGAGPTIAIGTYYL